MRTSADAATAAIREARAADAMTWAPDELLTAEDAARRALVAKRIEETRFWPIPDAARVSGRVRRGRTRAPLPRRRDRIGGRSPCRRPRSAIAQSGRRPWRRARVPRRPSTWTPPDGACSRRPGRRSRRRACTSARATSAALPPGRATPRIWPHRCATTPRQVAGRYADAETLARWRRWKEETIAWSRREGRAAIVVAKEAHLLTLFVRGSAREDLHGRPRASTGSPTRRARATTRRPRAATTSSRGGPGGAFYKALLLDYPERRGSRGVQPRAAQRRPAAVGRHRRADRDPRRRRPRPRLDRGLRRPDEHRHGRPVRARRRRHARDHRGERRLWSHRRVCRPIPGRTSRAPALTAARRCDGQVRVAGRPGMRRRPCPGRRPERRCAGATPARPDPARPAHRA